LLILAGQVTVLLAVVIIDRFIRNLFVDNVAVCILRECTTTRQMAVNCAQSAALFSLYAAIMFVPTISIVDAFM
jgi:hypothetical protein